MKVRIDRSIRPLLERFLARCSANLRSLDEALAAGDYAAIAAIAHGLAGAGGTYGLGDVSVLGRRIEQAARAGEGERVAPILEELRRFLAELEPEFE